MERKEVETRVNTVTAQVLKIDESEINPNSNFVFDLGADSMQSLQLVAAFEEEFEIEMEEDEALAVQSVSDAIDFIKNIVDRVD